MGIIIKMLKITLAAMGLLTLALAQRNVTIPTHYFAYPNVRVAHPQWFDTEVYVREFCESKNCTAYTCDDGLD